MPNPENLTPFPKGVSGNPKGRPKGIKNWSTVVQQLLADETLMDKISKSKPSYWDELPNKNAANAIVVAMIIEALKGKKDAAEWLRKAGFGDKLMHEFEDGLFQATKIEVEIVKSKIEDERDPES
jgi:uncharacterized protein DUF5681